MHTFHSLRLYIMKHTALKICALHIQYTFTRFPYNILYICLVCHPVLSISFISPTSSLLKSKCSLLFDLYLLLTTLSFHILPFSYGFSLILFILFYFSISFLPHYVSFHGIDQILSRQWFRQICEDPGLKMETDVTLYEVQDGSPKVVSSARMSGVGVIDPDEFPCHLHGFELSRGYSSGTIVVNAVVTQKDGFSISYPYKFHCTSMKDVPETLPDVSKYGFYVLD